MPITLTPHAAFFADHALDFASCPIDRQSFHQNAQAQQRNLRRLSQTTFKHQLHLSDEEGVCIEPSFFCEMLGLQGRIDLMKPDGTVVVEQKSGKIDEFNRTAHHEHEIQLMLYMAMRHYAFQQPYSRLQGYLLYSQISRREKHLAHSECSRPPARSLPHPQRDRGVRNGVCPQRHARVH